MGRRLAVTDALDFAQKRIAAVARLDKRFGCLKLHLLRDGERSIGESIWCVPKTAPDQAKMTRGSPQGDKARVSLVNMPLPGGMRCGGAEVIATTQGPGRPPPLPSDQPPLDRDAAL